MSGLKPRRLSSSLTTWRSDDISRSSFWSLTSGATGGFTSWGAGAGGGGGAGTGVVSTLRADGLVIGFFFGPPYRKVSRPAITIQTIHFRLMVSPRAKRRIEKARLNSSSRLYQNGSL